ncbi:MAG: ZIP family metal transporter [Gammaproteobacteria bacterium]
MDTQLLLILIASQFIGLAGVLTAALTTWHISDAGARRLVAFAAGTMLAMALLDILPEALALGGADTVMPLVLAGLLGFFTLQKLSLWRHAHVHDTAAVNAATNITSAAHAPRSHIGWTIVAGDGLHNFTDGVLIAAAFMADTHLGWLTTLAIVAHEIPQETGDFLALRWAGYSARQALGLNLLASLPAVIGGALAWAMLQQAASLLPYVLAISAASFLYIAISDLLPALNREWCARETTWHLALIGAGIALIHLLHHVLPGD